MILISPAFENNKEIPPKYTCDDLGINPPLQIDDVPQNTKSLALIVEDPDAPVGLWIHWMIWNIPPTTTGIPENSIPEGIVGRNSSGNKSWDDICPPDSEHRYIFKVFALNKLISLDAEVTIRDDFYAAINPHIIGKAELTGLYNRYSNR